MPPLRLLPAKLRVNEFLDFLLPPVSGYFSHATSCQTCLRVSSLLVRQEKSG